jgi:hypothetical protein
MPISLIVRTCKRELVDILTFDTRAPTGRENVRMLAHGKTTFPRADASSSDVRNCRGRAASGFQQVDQGRHNIIGLHRQSKCHGGRNEGVEKTQVHTAAR